MRAQEVNLATELQVLLTVGFYHGQKKYGGRVQEARHGNGWILWPRPHQYYIRCHFVNWGKGAGVRLIVSCTCIKPWKNSLQVQCIALVLPGKQY